MLQNLKQKAKDQLVFSSDDSLNSNNSFASSVEDDDKEDFSNHFLNLKDQMEHFFSQNPQLQEDMKFEPFKEPNSDDEENINNKHHDYNNPSSVHNTSAAAHQQNKINKNIYHGPKIEHRNLEEIDRKRAQSAGSSSDSSEDYSTQAKRKVQFEKNNSQSNNANKEKSKLWKVMSKDIVRMGQFGCKTPTLETVNHRLNIFKAKIEKIDYLEYLQKEMMQTAGGSLTQQQNGGANNINGQINNNNSMPNTSSQISQGVGNNNIQGISGGQNGESGVNGNGFVGNVTSVPGNASSNGQQDEEDNDVGRDSNGNLVYFSFKKKQQMHLAKQIERTQRIKENEEIERKKEAKFKTSIGGRRANMVSRGAIDARKLITEQELQEKKKRANTAFVVRDSQRLSQRKSFTGLKNEGNNNNNNTNDQAKEEAVEKDQSLTFTTRVGMALYQTYQQCGGDKESFKKTANFILKDYNKTKMQFYKKKPFPPQITKFTNEETKALNVFFPDFTSNLYAPNKANLFANIDQFQLQPGTPEGDFIAVVDKILDGAVLSFWKESQNQANQGK